MLHHWQRETRPLIADAALDAGGNTRRAGAIRMFVCHETTTNCGQTVDCPPCPPPCPPWPCSPWPRPVEPAVPVCPTAPAPVEERFVYRR